MSTIFEGSKIEPWVAMKIGGGLRGRPEIQGDLSKAVVVYMTPGMIQPQAASWNFEHALNGATTLIFDDAHFRNLEMELLLQQLPDIIRGLTRPLQVILMSATLDIDVLERFFENCKTYALGGFTPF